MTIYRRELPTLKELQELAACSTNYTIAYCSDGKHELVSYPPGCGYPFETIYTGNKEWIEDVFNRLCILKDGSPSLYTDDKGYPHHNNVPYDYVQFLKENRVPIVTVEDKHKETLNTKEG